MSGVEAVAETSKKAGRVKCVVAAGVLAPVAVVACVYVSVIAPHTGPSRRSRWQLHRCRRRIVRYKPRLMLLSSRSIRDASPLMWRCKML